MPLPVTEKGPLAMRASVGWKSGVVLVVASMLSTGVREAAADVKDDVAACLAAHTTSQALRLDGKLVEAKKALLVCAQDKCPSIARVDCTRWLGEVEESLPTIVVAVKDVHGRAMARFTLSIDDVKITERRAGGALSIDAGEHTFRIELDDGPPIVEKRVVLQGKKNQELLFERSAPAPSPPASTTTSRPPTASPPPRPATASTMTWVLAGTTVLALGSFAYFGLTGMRDEDRLRGSCPQCSRSDLDGIKQKYLVADISWILAIVAGGGAAILHFTRSQSDSPSSASR